MKPSNQQGFNAIDLFSGAGGLTLGLKRAGFRVVGAVELDDLAAETYSANHPEVQLWQEDIRGLDPRKVRRALGLRRGELHLLAGCPPCQGFSSLRTRWRSISVEDDRNELLFRFLDFVVEFRPRAIMMENVPALARDSRFFVFAEKLQCLGYYISTDVLDAAAFGVPQRRRRLIVLAGDSKPISLAQPIPYRYTVRETIGFLPEAGNSGDSLHDLPETRTAKVVALIRAIPKDGGSRSSLGKDHQLDCHKRCKGFYDVYGRMSWNDVAPTITGGCANPSKGRFLHPDQDRCITLREAALLQGFPMTYKFSLRRGKYSAAEMIGNALPPEFVQRQAAQVIKHLGG
ncbi:MAG: DNA cytosine methyltransferase [Desulfarculus sp.]|nr:DNA cytosine methyltransferase [Desulfarculus sp.]